jgi:hypothetical protein
MDYQRAYLLKAIRWESLQKANRWENLKVSLRMVNHWACPR